MKLRAAVAAGLLAAVGLGCTEAPKSRTANTTPQARVVAPKMKLGSYTMTVTPLPQFGGRRASVVVVPDAQDGNPSTNPAGSVQVAGRFNAVIEPAGATGCVGSQSLGLPLLVTNFAVEPLLNVQVQVTSMSKTGFEVCKVGGGSVGTGLGDPTLLPPPGNVAPGASLGLGDYGTLVGAANGATPVNTGAFPGGFRSLTWWFKFPSNTPVTFKFVVWADPQEPVPNSVAELAPGAALTWTSAGSATSQLQLCATDPALTDFRCPSPVVTQATALGGGAFSAIPTIVDGTTYWWRAANTFSGGTATNVAANYASGWDSFVATAPAAAAAPTLVAPLGTSFPADVLATAAPILLQWNTAAAITDTVYQICTAACPVPFNADPLALNAGNLVYEDVVAWTSAAIGYEADVAPFLPTDPLTGDAWLATGTYVWTVSNYDFNSGAVIGASSSSTFTIAPVGAAAPDVTAPLAGELVPANVLALNTPVLATWTTDPAISESQFRLCDTANCLPATGFAGVVAAPPALVGFAPSAGAPYEYTADLLLLIPTDVVNTGGAWLLPGTYWLEVSNVVGGVAVGAPTVVSFQVVPSTPGAPAITGPAGAVPANTVANLLPINLTWTADTFILEGEVHVCGGTVCTGDPLVDAIVVPVLAAGPGAFLYDAGAAPDFLFDPAVSTISSGYLTPGIYHWSAYNIDPVSLVTLLPGSNSTVVISAVPYGTGAFTVATSGLSVAGSIVVSWTGPKAVSTLTYEIYDAALGIVDTNILTDDNSLGAANSHFSTANIAAFLTANATYSWNVIDDGLATTFPFTLGAVPATDAIWTTGTFTTVP